MVTTIRNSNGHKINVQVWARSMDTSGEGNKWPTSSTWKVLTWSRQPDRSCVKNILLLVLPFFAWRRLSGNVLEDFPTDKHSNNDPKDGANENRMHFIYVIIINIWILSNYVISSNVSTHLFNLSYVLLLCTDFFVFFP